MSSVRTENRKRNPRRGRRSSHSRGKKKQDSMLKSKFSPKTHQPPNRKSDHCSKTFITVRGFQALLNKLNGSKLNYNKLKLKNEETKIKPGQPRTKYWHFLQKHTHTVTLTVTHKTKEEKAISFF